VIQLSSRFAAALLLMAGAAAALRLGALHDARGADACAAPGALKATSLIPGTTALGERLEALDRDTIQWSEGEVTAPEPGGLPMRFQIVRSYDAPRLYGNALDYAAPLGDGPHAEAARLEPEDIRVRELVLDGVRVPIRVAWDHTGALGRRPGADRSEAGTGASRLAAWLFVFDNHPVRSPLRAQLGHALDLAIGGARPLTLVTISALATPETAAPVEDAAVAWLGRAWSYVSHACRPR
jgi:hypothetical protein